MNSIKLEATMSAEALRYIRTPLVAHVRMVCVVPERRCTGRNTAAESRPACVATQCIVV